MTAKSARTLGILAAAFGLATLALPAAADQASEIAAVKAATEKYNDIAVALAEGFIAPEGCISAAGEGLPPELGAMGIHYIHPGMLKITDGADPEDLRGERTCVLRPRPLGSLQLDENLGLVIQQFPGEALLASPAPHDQAVSISLDVESRHPGSNEEGQAVHSVSSSSKLGETLSASSGLSGTPPRTA